MTNCTTPTGESVPCTYVRHLELVNAYDPASGEVKLENPYAD